MQLPLPNTEPVRFAELNTILATEFADIMTDEEKPHIYAPPDPPNIQSRHLAINKSNTVCMKLPTDKELEELNWRYINGYSDVFADKLPNQLPPQNSPKHRIILKDEKKLIKGRLMRVPTKYLAGFKQWIDDHVKAGRLVPSASHISSGTLLTPKKDSELFPRVVHDYRTLNENTVKDHTPLPRQDQILEFAARAKIRGKVDLVSAYYQHWVDKRDQHKTAILTPWGLYEWTVMPQGLCNAVATWQRFMNWVLREYIGKFCVVYLDDILIFSNSLEEHK